MEEIPEGLHEMQYAVHVLEEILGWPVKGNGELVADCIKAIGRSRKLTPKKAYIYLVRAVRLAKEQSIEVNRFWFQGGEYMNMRPEKSGIKDYKPLDRAKTIAEQSTPEWEESSKRAREVLARIAGKAAAAGMP